MKKRAKTNSYYRGADPKELTIRDVLARERTMLANERTVLSYVRTGFAFIASGGTIWKFYADDRSMVMLAIVLLAIGTVVTVIGLIRFLQVRVSMRHMLEQPSSDETK